MESSKRTFIWYTLRHFSSGGLSTPTSISTNSRRRRFRTRNAQILQARPNYFLLGDFNARTGTLNDFVENDCQDFTATDNAYDPDKNWPKRNNADYSFNKLGEETLRLCIGNKLRILNGRVTGDLDGKLTSYQYNGASTVDYGMVSEHLPNIVLGFQVQALTPYFDHCPVTLKLACSNRENSCTAPTYQKRPSRTEASSRYYFTKLLWKPESKDTFVSTS